jgi:hypothetical protein
VLRIPHSWFQFRKTHTGRNSCATKGSSENNCFTAAERSLTRRSRNAIGTACLVRHTTKELMPVEQCFLRFARLPRAIERLRRPWSPITRRTRAAGPLSRRRAGATRWRSCLGPRSASTACSRLNKPGQDWGGTLLPALCLAHRGRGRPASGHSPSPEYDRGSRSRRT